MIRRRTIEGREPAVKDYPVPGRRTTILYPALSHFLELTRVDSEDVITDTSYLASTMDDEKAVGKKSAKSHLSMIRQSVLGAIEAEYNSRFDSCRHELLKAEEKLATIVPLPLPPFVRRSDLPGSSRVPQKVLDALIKAEMARIHALRRDYWQTCLFNARVKVGLVDPFGVPLRIPFAKNRRRRALRLAQTAYRSRIRLESKPGYTGPRLVVGAPVVRNFLLAHQAAETNLREWIFGQNRLIAIERGQIIQLTKLEKQLARERIGELLDTIRTYQENLRRDRQRALAVLEAESEGIESAYKASCYPYQELYQTVNVKSTVVSVPNCRIRARISGIDEEEPEVEAVYADAYTSHLVVAPLIRSDYEIKGRTTYDDLRSMVKVCLRQGKTVSYESPCEGLPCEIQALFAFGRELSDALDSGVIPGSALAYEAVHSLHNSTYVVDLAFQQLHRYLSPLLSSSCLPLPTWEGSAEEQHMWRIDDTGSRSIISLVTPLNGSRPTLPDVPFSGTLHVAYPMRSNVAFGTNRWDDPGYDLYENPKPAKALSAYEVVCRVLNSTPGPNGQSIGRWLNKYGILLEESRKMTLFGHPALKLLRPVELGEPVSWQYCSAKQLNKRIAAIYGLIVGATKVAYSDLTLIDPWMFLEEKQRFWIPVPAGVHDVVASLTPNFHYRTGELHLRATLSLCYIPFDYTRRVRFPLSRAFPDLAHWLTTGKQDYRPAWLDEGDLALFEGRRVSIEHDRERGVPFVDSDLNRLLLSFRSLLNQLGFADIR